MATLKPSPALLWSTHQAHTVSRATCARAFHTSPRTAAGSPLLNLSGLSISRESQFLSKERRIPRTEFSPHLELIRSSEVDPYVSPRATPLEPHTRLKGSKDIEGRAAEEAKATHTITSYNSPSAASTGITAAGSNATLRHDDHMMAYILQDRRQMKEQVERLQREARGYRIQYMNMKDAMSGSKPEVKLSKSQFEILDRKYQKSKRDSTILGVLLIICTTLGGLVSWRLETVTEEMKAFKQDAGRQLPERPGRAAPRVDFSEDDVPLAGQHGEIVLQREPLQGNDMSSGWSRLFWASGS